MESPISENFNDLFKYLTNFEPFPWQKRLFRNLLEREVPEYINIPTGCGKTSIIHINFLVYCHFTYLKEYWPRLTTYVINRRSVVDQVSEEATQLKNRIKSEDNKLLKELGFSKINVSTSRGQYEEDKQWLYEPHVPAVIVGTVDMIGSKLLYRGYRSSFKDWSIEAGQIGQNNYIILDEAHLEVPFLKTLSELDFKSKAINRETYKTFMSATIITNSNKIFSLDDEDYKNEIIKKRVNAIKKTSYYEVLENDFLNKIKELVDIRLESNKKTIIFLQRVNDVYEIEKYIKSKGGNAIILTGTMRGAERNLLIKNEIFKRFLPENDKKSFEQSFLICTSAGEVGINISGDDCICDCTTYESMVQRFGRINRFGNYEANIDVIFKKCKY